MEEYYVLQLENGDFLYYEWKYDLRSGMLLKLGSYPLPTFATRISKECFNPEIFKMIKDKHPGTRVVKIRASFSIVDCSAFFE